MMRNCFIIWKFDWIIRFHWIILFKPTRRPRPPYWNVLYTMQRFWMAITQACWVEPKSNKDFGGYMSNCKGFQRFCAEKCIFVCQHCPVGIGDKVEPTAAIGAISLPFWHTKFVKVPQLFVFMPVESSAPSNPYLTTQNCAIEEKN